VLPQGKRRHLVQLETIAVDGGIDFLCVAVDTAIETYCSLEAMAAEPGALIKDASSLMIEEDNGSLLFSFGEEFFLNLLGHELRPREVDGFEFLARAAIEDDWRRVIFQLLGKVVDVDQHFGVVLLTLFQAKKSRFERDFMFLTHLFQGIIEFIRAGLAAADMEGGEKGAPCSRVAFKKRGHGLLAIHEGTMGVNGRKSKASPT